MLIIEALGALQFLKKELISLSDLSNILGLGRAAMSGRVQRKSVLKPEEIAKIEQFYNVDLVGFIERIKASETSAAQSPQDKKELAKLIKETVTEMILEKGGQELYDKIFKQF